MDPLAAWVDLEPPLAAAGSGLAMAATASQGAVVREGAVIDAHRCGFAGAEGPHRGAAQWRRVHPLVVARAGEGARDSVVAFSDSLVVALVAVRKRDEGVC
jgi:hypothetical protein